MWWYLFGRRKAAAKAQDRRWHDRFATHAMLRCALGEVTDLSISGMRVVRHGKTQAKPGQVMLLTIRSAQQQLTVHARVTWVSRSGMRRYELGVQFVSVSPATGRALEALARYGFVEPAAGKAKPLQRVTGGQTELYKVLGVAEGAGPQEVRAAYRALAVQYHPDHNSDPAAHAKFQEIHNAYVAIREAMRRKGGAGAMVKR